MLALLGGCVTPPQRRQPEALPWPQSRAQLQALAGFELRGRLGVKAGTEGFSAGLDWQQAGARSTVVLEGPLGVGGVHIVSEGATLTVRNARGQLLDSDAARDELVAKLGFEPPIGSLRYWVLGVPDPSRPATETLGPEQRLSELQQDGWHVAYTAYMPASVGWLPQKLTLDRGTVRVRVVVESWHA